MALPTAPTAAALLAAWEVGAAAAPVDRAPSLLRSLGALPSDLSVERLTVGQCDARLFALRREMFGDALDAVSTCPACGTEIQMVVPLDRLQPQPSERPAPTITLSHDGYSVTCRIPLNEDLRALAQRGEDARVEDLLERCVVQARAADGRALAAGELAARHRADRRRRAGRQRSGRADRDRGPLPVRRRMDRRARHPRRSPGPT